MTSERRNVWLGIAGVALAQAMVLGWIIWERAQLLANGREVVLEVIPVDPRDLFRGDYVVLGYDMSRLEIPAGAPPPKRGDDIYVTLQKDEAGKWKVVGSSAQPSADTTSDQVVIKGRVTYATSGSEQSPALTVVRYGIENFFN